MLKLNLTADDAVLMCMPVAVAHTIVAGSIETTCAECDLPIWRAPGPPCAKVGDDGRLQLVPGIVPPKPTVLLCIRCARLHYELVTGRTMTLTPIHTDGSQHG